MTNLKYLFLALGIAAGTVGARADIVSPYSVDFNTAINTSSHDFKAALGWGHVVGSYYDSDDYETYYVNYTYQSTGGLDDSGCLQVGTQSLGSGWSTSTVRDALVTPLLTGTASVYVKQAASSGTVTFYTVTQSGTTYTLGSQISVTLPELSTTEFVRVDIPLGEESQMVGIVGNNVYLDEFAAPSAEVNATAALKITKVAYTSQTYYDCDPDGNVSFSYKVLVQNTGDVDFTPGYENYSLSVVNYSQSNAVVATVPITQSLAAGAVSDTIEVPFTYNIATYPNRNRYDVMENITGTTSYGTWIEPVAYAPNFVFTAEGSSAAYSGTGLEFGLTAVEVSKTHNFRNTGAAPLTITEVSVPEGYEVSVTTPLTIAAHGEEPVTITLKVDVPGTKVGNMVVKGNDIEDYTLPLTGAVVDPTKWYVNFEDEAFPAGSVPGDNWSVTNYPNQVNIANNRYCAANGNVVGTKFISPLLHVEEGETLVFDAARRSTNSTVNVYYSTDRKEWTQVRALSAASSTAAEDLLPSTTYSSNKYKFKQFAIDNVPAGDYYIAFESGYAYLDNIMGYTVVDVAHDVMLNSTAFPATGNVNKRYEGVVSLKNVAATAEAADSYTAELKVGEEVIATAAAVEMAGASDTQFTFGYTPHAAGEVEAVAVFSFADNYVVEVPVSFTINPESATEEIVVGEKSATQAYAPFSTNYRNSETEQIYTAEQLGLQAGAKIGRIAFHAYNTAGDLETNVRVWIENTEDVANNGTTMADTLAMTKIYDAAFTFEKKGSYSAPEEMFAIDLAEPFEYTGNSIRIHCIHTSSTYKNVYFEVQSNITNQALYHRSDASLEAAQSATPSACGLPVLYLGVVKSPAVVSGVVTDAKTGAPIEGAVVKLVSTTDAQLVDGEGDTTPEVNEADRVIYTAVTEADGSYTLDVVQAGLQYVATVSAEGYKSYTADVDFAGESTFDLNAALEVDPSTGVSDLSAAGVKVYGTVGALVVEADAAAQVNVYNMAGAVVARVNATAGTTRVALPQGIYVAARTKVVVK